MLSLLTSYLRITTRWERASTANKHVVGCCGCRMIKVIKHITARYSLPPGTYVWCMIGTLCSMHGSICVAVWSSPPTSTPHSPPVQQATAKRHLISSRPQLSTEYTLGLGQRYLATQTRGLTSPDVSAWVSWAMELTLDCYGFIPTWPLPFVRTVVETRRPKLAV